MPNHTNRLIHESSPYLQQHAHNPVEWYPWGEEALQTARRRNRPILLSIGYSACHWCHVMEHESFEDEATAALMNQHFVNIKVDREERPDIDQVYMSAVQLLTGRGGWPLTVFLTPDGEPFYGGTYFPPEDRHGMPGFRRVLLAVAQAYAERPHDVRNSVAQLMTALRRTETHRASGQAPDRALIGNAAAALVGAYDQTNGGLGGAPKFPNVAILELFLHAHRSTGERRYLDMVLHTLRQMARGGIYDQLGGGFHRYSVDERWLVPHFEKMLYDNAQLVPLYLSAFQLTRDRFFADIAADVLDYVGREMRDPQGGFYSTQDADSEGEEGKFFLWDQAEVTELLGEEAAVIVCRYWDVSKDGNFEHRNILHASLEIEQLAKLFGRDVDSLRLLLRDARKKLFAARESRCKPGRDDKIVTSWNALMISAFAKAAEVLGGESYRQAAVSAAGFIESKLQCPDRSDRLLSIYKDGVAKHNGYLDDYAFLVAALVDLFEATQESLYLGRAVAYADSMIANFWDQQAGGFFFTSHDHETLIVRSKPTFDGSIPSGNAVAACSLLRLYHYTQRSDYLARAEQLLRLFREEMAAQPFGFACMLRAVDLYVQQPHEIVVVGKHDAGETGELLAKIRQTYLPNRTLTVVDPANGDRLPPLLRGKGQIDGRPTVYVCRNMTCSPPATDWSDVEQLLL